MTDSVEGGGGSQEGGGVNDPPSDVLIYAVRLLDGGVKETGSDRSRSNSLDSQAPGISRKLLLSPVAIVQVTFSSPARVVGRGGSRGKGEVWWRGGNKNHGKPKKTATSSFFVRWRDEQGPHPDRALWAAIATRQRRVFDVRFGRQRHSIVSCQHITDPRAAAGADKSVLASAGLMTTGNLE